MDANSCRTLNSFIRVYSRAFAVKIFGCGGLVGYFAVIAAWAGEKDLAIEQLNAAAPLHGAAFITSYGVLKLMPFWDPLRGDPRFEKIVASLAPTQNSR